MGLVYADITLGNDAVRSLAPVRIKALVDSGATMLVIPPEVEEELQLEERDKAIVTTADGTTRTVRMVGGIRIHFENRTTCCDALVMGNQVLLGAIPMQGMDVIISPKEEKLIVPPDHPNFPHMLVK